MVWTCDADSETLTVASVDSNRKIRFTDGDWDEPKYLTIIEDSREGEEQSSFSTKGVAS